MAQIKTTTKLVLEPEFVDGDTRTITLDDPKANLTEENIRALNSSMLKCVIGDKTGAQFLRFKTAKTVNNVSRLYSREDLQQ